jgi:hypothetical protein
MVRKFAKQVTPVFDIHAKKALKAAIITAKITVYRFKQKKDVKSCYHHSKNYSEKPFV